MDILRLTGLIFLITFSNFCFSELWKSPVEEKYRIQSPELFKEFEEAKSLYNNLSSQNRRATFQKSANILQHILEKDDTFAPAYYQLTRILASSGYLQTHEGINILNSLLNQAIELEPQYSDAYIYHANIQRRIGNSEQARLYLLKAKKFNTISPWYSINMGRLEMNNNTEVALSYFEDVMARIDVSPVEKSIASHELIKYHHENKQYKKVAKYYEIMTEVEPDESNHWLGFGKMLVLKLNKSDEAIVVLEKAFTLAPQSEFYKLQAYLAVAYYDKWFRTKETDKKQAQEYFDLAKKYNANTQLVYNTIALEGLPGLQGTLDALGLHYGIKEVGPVMFKQSEVYPDSSESP